MVNPASQDTADTPRAGNHRTDKEMRSDRLFVEVGKALALIQMSDKVLKIVLLLVFPGREFNDISLYRKNERVLDRATLGKLISILRKRVVLSDQFEGILETYLADRNSLVHCWDDIDRWEVEEAAIGFTINVQKHSAYLLYVFTAFLRSWMVQVGMTDIDERYSELDGLFNTIDTEWEPLISELIVDVIYAPQG